jgi:hypothetical protein
MHDDEARRDRSSSVACVFSGDGRSDKAVEFDVKHVLSWANYRAWNGSDGGINPASLAYLATPFVIRNSSMFAYGAFEVEVAVLYAPTFRGIESLKLSAPVISALSTITPSTYDLTIFEESRSRQ